MSNVNKQRPYARLPLLMVFMTITALGIGGTALYTIQRHLIERAGASLAVQAAEIADQLDHVLFERYGDIQVAAAALPSHMGDPAALDRYLHSLEDQYVVYRWLAVTDTDVSWPPRMRPTPGRVAVERRGFSSFGANAPSISKMSWNQNSTGGAHGRILGADSRRGRGISRCRHE